MEGDPYNVTLARDHHARVWVVACWGDLAEEYEKENELGDYEVFDSCPDVCPSCGKRHTFEIKSFERGAWKGTPPQWYSDGTGYSFVCQSCNHHCMTAEDWTPPDEDTDTDDDDDDEERQTS